MSALISFFGGSVFRMLWVEIAAYLTRKQEHAQEIERLKLQEAIAAAQHDRNLSAIRVQAELGVKTIEVQADAAVRQIEAEGWLEAVKGVSRVIGIAWIDGWNAIIRPGVATWSIVMITLSELGVFVLSDVSASICSAALGIYLAERNLVKRGK